LNQCPKGDELGSELYRQVMPKRSLYHRSMSATILEEESGG